MLSLRFCTLALSISGALMAQYPGLTLPYSGNNQKATVVQTIGPVTASIEYSSPAVHGPDGRDRRGQIWGRLVPYGMTDPGFGTAKLAPWRAGANENTVFAVSHDVTIEGKPLAAGRYGLHMVVGADDWILIFSKNSTAWGSFFYDIKDDALRVTVRPRKHEYREYLTYEFPVRKPDEAVAEMQWEDLAVGWTIRVPNVNQIYMTKLRQELESMTGFNYLAFVNAASFSLQTNTDLQQGLLWAEAAITRPFVGQANFRTLSTKAQILAKLGQAAEAKEVMAKALRLPGTSPAEIHQYGRQLLAANQNAEAMEVFKLNAERNGDTWPVHVGLARGYAAMGDNKTALEHAKKALAQAPDELNRNSLKQMVETLSKTN